MKTLFNTSMLLINLSVLTYTGAVLFGAGTLTTLGMIVVPLAFVGSAGGVAVSGTNLFNSAKEAWKNRKAAKTKVTA